MHVSAGTGKTTTLVQLILALLAAKPHSKILVASESNQGVDNLLEKVISALASAADKAVSPELSGILRVGALKSIQNSKASHCLPCQQAISHAPAIAWTSGMSITSNYGYMRLPFQIVGTTPCCGEDFARAEIVC